MKSFLAFVLIFAAIIAVALGADCEVEGHKFNIGEKYHPPGKCEEITCTAKNAVAGKGCAQMNTLRPCKYIPMDTTKEYPACCPRYEC